MKGKRSIQRMDGKKKLKIENVSTYFKKGKNILLCIYYKSQI